MSSGPAGLCSNIQEMLADFGTRVDGAEYIAASAMIERGIVPSVLLVCLYRFPRAKKNKRVISHRGNRLYRKSADSTSPVIIEAKTQWFTVKLPNGSADRLDLLGG